MTLAQFKNTTIWEGKYYAMDRQGSVLVWRIASYRTSRYHWVLCRNPPRSVVEILKAQEEINA